MTNPISEDKSPIVGSIKHMKYKLIENGARPDIIAIKGTEYQKLLRELEQPEPTLFGMKIVIKPDDSFPDNTNIIVANNMSTYQPIELITIEE